jgi:hypothetical protein
MFHRYLLHDKLMIRFAALSAIAVVLFVGVWTLSYLFLPEGILRGRNLGAVLAGTDLAGGSVLLEWLRIVAINLGVMLVLIVAPNLLRTEHDYPLGYLTAVILSILYAVTLGTGSFALAQGGRIMPSLAVLGRSGPYEIAAYVLAATSTYSIAKARLKGRWPKQSIEAIVADHPFRLRREQWLGLGFAVVTLLVSNAWEAYRIMLYFAE